MKLSPSLEGSMTLTTHPHLVTLVRSRLEFASAAWNTLTSTDASKLEFIQRKLLALS
jgi:hypothetical protein